MNERSVSNVFAKGVRRTLPSAANFTKRFEEFCSDVLGYPSRLKESVESVERADIVTLIVFARNHVHVKGVMTQVLRQHFVEVMYELVKFVLGRPQYPTKVVRAIG